MKAEEPMNTNHTDPLQSTIDNMQQLSRRASLWATDGMMSEPDRQFWAEIAVEASDLMLKTMQFSAGQPSAPSVLSFDEACRKIAQGLAPEHGKINRRVELVKDLLRQRNITTPNALREPLTTAWAAGQSFLHDIEWQLHEQTLQGDITPEAAQQSMDAAKALWPALKPTDTDILDFMDRYNCNFVTGVRRGWDFADNGKVGPEAAITLRQNDLRDGRYGTVRECCAAVKKSSGYLTASHDSDTWMLSLLDYLNRSFVDLKPRGWHLDHNQRTGHQFAFTLHPVSRGAVGSYDTVREAIEVAMRLHAGRLQASKPESSPAPPPPEPTDTEILDWLDQHNVNPDGSVLNWSIRGHLTKGIGPLQPGVVAMELMPSEQLPGGTTNVYASIRDAIRRFDRETHYAPLSAHLPEARDTVMLNMMDRHCRTFNDAGLPMAWCLTSRQDLRSCLLSQVPCPSGHQANIRETAKTAMRAMRGEV